MNEDFLSSLMNESLAEIKKSKSYRLNFGVYYTPRF